MEEYQVRDRARKQSMREAMDDDDREEYQARARARMQALRERRKRDEKK